ncbi:C40 family peptidase [Collinsella aerofaciens]|uniref:C40 family peptidase n=1 Tax=Collinsella aerofaciens TaxID=74426 RepID=UPI001D0127A7|nr:C40 family peptidase [Collinsella aerofaciens]MCB5368961.1 C40 family peptidase [Collinsella aerofaciens]
MSTVVRRFPTFELELITENTSYELTYDTYKQLKESDFEEALLSFSVKNSMADDSPVFSLVITAKEKWDKLINSNDLIRIKAIPDTTKEVPDNPYIMVGLISDIHKEGEYGDGSLLYRITGQAMTKALMNFDVGVIQEVATIIPEIGWLPDGTENGLHFTGNTAAGIGTELMERFIYKYAKYSFANGKGLKDYLIHNFTSWEKDEQLTDPTPFINYEGSLRQFLEDVAAKPFNELFFEYTSNGECAVIMRPTPFDPDKWYQLPTYRFTSDIVVQESYGKNDNEVYSVFVVQTPNILDFNSMDLGVYPKFHPELIKKYGYKRLDAQNRYLQSADAVDNATDATSAEDPTSGQLPSYEDLVTFITNNKLNDPETLRTQKNDVYAAIKTEYPDMSKSLVNGIIDELKSKTFTRDSYNTLIQSSGDSKKTKAINKEKSVAYEKLNRFTQRLYNWYCENANFYSGDIRVLGHPAYRIGSRILYDDFEQDTTWEFYLESVQHEFSFTNGYTTILGVTRGLPEGGAKRFTNLWGQSQDFKGGYLGEKSLEDLVASAKAAQSDATVETSWGNGGGSGVALQALATAQSLTSQRSIYTFGGGRSGKNPFYSSPIRCDCSSFVWWCYYVHGVGLNGGKTGMTTDTIAQDSRLTLVSSRGSSKVQARSLLQKGDLVWFDTYKADGHIGIYAGNGKFIGCQSSTGISEANMTSGYWWDHFNGHVARYTG